MQIQIFTDGSCHTQQKIGGWAAVILFEGEVFKISGNEKDTTHNAMEILAVLKALNYVKTNIQKTPNNNNTFTKIEIVSDSQYVVGILERKEKLIQNYFLTKKKTPIRNVELVKQLIQKIETLPLTFTKIKAHQKRTNTINYNRVVDKMARAEVRKFI